MPDVASEKSIFLHAAGLDSPVARAAYLDAACGPDPAVRARIEGLLAAHDRLGGDPPPTAGPDSTVPPAGPEIGAVLGDRFKLVEVLGEGGMGEVWLAQQQEPVKRLVALKVIKAGMDSRQVLARFEAERQALALMDHPNIAKVLDAGATPEGRPFFVMELVKGVPITKYCDDHQLTPRQRLELFVPVCQAVQHAHQKGVIHRDLKPSNVLVAPYDGRPVPKVIDFGVAKAAGQPLTDKTLVTGLGAVVGTPEYMSPEQAELNNQDVDTRSDVYALGVLLYELLTGSPPFTKKDLDKAGMLEMLRVIREQEPSKPSTKLSTAEGLPTLAANRGTEPAKLTRLVRGELDWIVMKALEKDRNRRYETANGFAMDLQRYLADEPVLACPPSAGYRLRKLVRRNKGALAVVSVVAVAVLLVVGSIGYMVRDRAAERMQRMTRIASQVELILQEVDQLEKEQKWPEALAAARRAETSVASGEAPVAIEQLVRDRLTDLEFIDRLEQIRMLRATWVVGNFDYAGANREYARAFREYGVDVEELPVETAVDRLKARPALAIPLAAALDEWVYVRRMISEKDAARWKRLVAVARGIDADPLRDRLRSTWGQPVTSELQGELRRLAQSMDIRAQLPATLASLAITLQRVKDSDAAVRLLRDAQAVYPGDFWLNMDLGHVLHTQKDYDGALRFWTAAVSIRPNSAPAHNNVGSALRVQKKLDEAIAACRKAIELDPGLAFAYWNLGLALAQQKKLDEAIAAYREASELNPKQVSYHVDLGFTLREQNKLEEAVAEFRKASELDPKLPQYHGWLGETLHAQGRVDEAIVEYRKAIELDPESAATHYNLGDLLKRKGDLDGAERAYREATRLDGKNHALAIDALSELLLSRGKVKEAIATWQEFLALSPQDASAHRSLGYCLKVKGNLDGALAAYRKAIEIDPKNAGARQGLGIVLRDQKKLAEAVVCYEEAIKLDPKAIWAYHDLGTTLRDQGKLEEAIAALRKAIDLMPDWAEVHDLLGTTLAQNEQHDEAMAAYRKAIEWKPDYAAAINNLADRLANHPDPKRRDPPEAVRLAKRAVELQPKYGNTWNTLGEAHYRAGDWKAAFTALEKAMELRKGGNSNDWFFLAMAHWRLGEKDKARQWYDKAVAWMDKNQPNDKELRRFRTEAAELLGVREKK